jgi:hypothetical protein
MLNILHFLPPILVLNYRIQKHFSGKYKINLETNGKAL